MKGVCVRTLSDKSYHGCCAREVREISGFDRVMVYKFDDNWHGEVIAEERRGDLEPFLGLHYPASDIPSQARELYRRNTLRFITDRSYEPSRIRNSSNIAVEPAELLAVVANLAGRVG